MAFAGMSGRPGAFAPFFSPIGFSWCSHAS